jgi:hypothetical protein
MKAVRVLCGAIILISVVGAVWSTVHIRALQSDRVHCGHTQNADKCWYNEVTTSLAADDVPQALRKISIFSKEDPKFSRICHGLMHLVGAQAYKDFKGGHPAPYSPEMNGCGFGFFHGFMETLLAHTLDYKEATAFCTVGDATSSLPMPRNECFHGIGHGLGGNHDPSEWKDIPLIIERTLSICKRIQQTDKDYLSCAGGVYNVVATAYYKGENDLVISPTDPFHICRITSRSTSEDRLCYNYMARVLTLAPPATIESSMHRALLYAPDPYVVDVVEGISAIYGNKHAPGDEVVSACEALPAYLQNACLYGYAAGFVQSSASKAEQQQVLAFCGHIRNKAAQYSCFERVIAEIRKDPHVGTLDYVCDFVEPLTRESCRAAL